MPHKALALHMPFLSMVKSGNILGFLLTLKFSITSFQQRRVQNTNEACKVHGQASQILQNSPLIDFEV